jgi:hypothetical protein
VAGAVAGLSALAGLPVGLAWWLLAPAARLEKRSEGVFLVRATAETAVAADGWFAVCGLVAGTVVAVAAAVLVRDQRLWVLAGLALGGILGSVVAWRLGVVLGPTPVETTAAGVREGARFDGPLGVSALGVLMTWSMAAVAVFFAAVAGLDAGAADAERADDPGEAAAAAPPAGPARPA